MNEESKNEAPAETKKETKTKNTGFPWWLWLVIILGLVAIGVVLILGLTQESSTATDSTTLPDTAEERTIKQYISSLRGDISRYYSQNNTYEGWQADQATIDQVEKMGSELRTGNLGQDSYIIYAKMPNSKTIFCIDNQNFTGEVQRLPNIATQCQ